jgi:2-amino-4-hydroxy-6-hydroxymethyldihydropteridine diphosphokinase
LKLERIRFFPKCRAKKAFFTHETMIGLGGNEGDVKKRFVKLYRFLQNDRRLFVRMSSPVLKNPPFGYTEQADFYNAVMVVQSSLHVSALLKVLLHVEKVFGRKRVFKNGPRTLDLDIIFFDNLKRKQKHIRLPHPHWEERLSVIVPLVMLKRCKG